VHGVWAARGVRGGGGPASLLRRDEKDEKDGVLAVNGGIISEEKP
jgi:hypothetical protein